MRKILTRNRDTAKKEDCFSPSGIIAFFYASASFALLDVWLRVVTRWLGMYSIYKPEPNLFTIAWSILLAFVVVLIPNQIISKIVYGIIYYLFATYAIIQYGYYLIFGKFLFLSDFSFAGEGAEYSNFVIDIITPSRIVLIGIFVLVGVAGIVLVPGVKIANKQKIKRNRIICVAGIAVCAVVIGFIPKLYEGGDENRA